MLNRAEHLACAKIRALQYVERGDLMHAYASMVSDLHKHPETRDHPALEEVGVLLQNLAPTYPMVWKASIRNFFHFGCYFGSGRGRSLRLAFLCSLEEARLFLEG